MKRRGFLKYSSIGAAGIAMMPGIFSQEAINNERYPFIKLSNGILDALVFIPDKGKGYYRSSRFDWSGFMAQVEFKRHTFFQDWTEKDRPGNGYHDPLNTAAGTGIAEEFRDPLGYEKAVAGDPFLKIGIGLLQKLNKNKYFFAENYKILYTGEWKTSSGSDWILFEQSINTELGYSYIYSKKISLTIREPEISVFHSLKNTGTLQIISNTYCHNFFCFDKDIPGTNYSLQFCNPIELSDSLKAKVSLDGNSIHLLNNIKEKDTVAGALTTGSGYGFTLSNATTGTKVIVSGDNPLSSFYVYISLQSLCPEPMIDLNIDPGSKQEWTIHYRFEANQQRRMHRTKHL